MMALLLDAVCLVYDLGSTVSDKIRAYFKGEEPSPWE